MQFIGIEGGATRSTAALMDESGLILKHIAGGPCNLALLSDAAVLKLWKNFRNQLSSSNNGTDQQPAAVGAFLAGNYMPSTQQRVLRLLKKVWANAQVTAGNDGESAMAAALGSDDGGVLICGTGSIILARRGNKTFQVGGHGSLAGDSGSGYWMGRELLRAIVHHYDHSGKLDPMGQSILTLLGLNTFTDLLTWSINPPRDEVASLAKIVFKHAQRNTPQRIIREAAALLARDAVLAAQKAGLRSPRIAFNRGIASYQPAFRKLITAEIRKELPTATVFLSETEGAVGAARLAKDSFNAQRPTFNVQRSKLDVGSSSPSLHNSTTPSLPAVASRGLSTALTEQRNPRTMDLHRRSVPRLIDTMLDEELLAMPKIRTQKKEIARVINWIVDSQKRGGRLFYIGAGTSGRVGVLDASECPPTYGLDAEKVQGIMAGGWRALYQSLESAEDDPETGRQAVRDRGINKKDVLIGIAASGSTPFVLGALREAHRLGVRTALLTFNPSATFSLPRERFQKIAIPTGPEVVNGSTRLKAGTATKLVLNMFSTISMVRLGKVHSNLMTHFAAKCCEKAQDRATRVYMALRPKVSYEEAWRRLEENKWDLAGLLKRK